MFTNKVNSVMQHFVAVDQCTFSVVPFECSVCGFLMRDLSDSLAYKKFACCNGCALKWAIAMGDEWHAGARPSQQEICQYREEQHRHPSYLVRVDNNI